MSSAAVSSGAKWAALYAAYDRAFWPLFLSQDYRDAEAVVREWLLDEADRDKRAFHLGFLEVVLIAQGQDAAALDVIHQRLRDAPDDPLEWGSLARFHSVRHDTTEFSPDPLRAALDAIDVAVEKARRTGHYLRFCLNDRCRIAVAMQRWDLLDDSLRQILAIPPGRGVPDIQLEDDFLRRVPDGVIDPKVMAAYRSAMAEQAARRASRPAADR
jgi:hypothetical protein